MAIQIMDAFTKEPPELDFVWPGFLAGTVGALVAPGATGKSFWALEAAMAVSCNVVGGDLVGLAPKHTGRVVYLAGEDPEPALVQRVHSIGKHLHTAAREAIADRLTIEPIVGKRLDIMKESHLKKVIDYCQDTRLIVLDTLSRVHTLDENSNGEMAQLVSTLEYLAAQTGASVLFLHHASKGSARDEQLDQQQAARGASALVDNARWVGYVAKMTKKEAERYINVTKDYWKYVRFGVSKQNYAEFLEEVWYERMDGGVLLPIRLFNEHEYTLRDEYEAAKKKGKKYDKAAY